MMRYIRIRLLAVLVAVIITALPATGWCAIASNNIPLDSPIYRYLGKLAGFGLIGSDIQGIRPFTKSEAVRLLREAENAAEVARLQSDPDTGETGGGLTDEIFARLRERLARETAQPDYPDIEPPPWLELAKPEYGRLRYLYLDGTPRSYFRPVWDRGNDGVFGIGSGLRPPGSPPPLDTVYQRGFEGTPLVENNEGTVYGRGSNLDLRVSLQGYSTRYLAFLVEPQILFSANRWSGVSAADDPPAGISGSGGSTVTLRVNKGYLKIGGGPLELEVGRDAVWFGPGERGNLTLTSNAQNLDLVKLSSPEPIDAGFLGLMKYALLVSRFDSAAVRVPPSFTGSVEDQPYLVAAKLSLKPAERLEIGINFARQFKDGFGGFGGTSGNTANSLAGIELRYRLPWFRNAELYGEFSGEDTAAFWPIVESYVAGIYFPRLTAGGRDDFRFEFFQGNQILYTNTSYPAGYTYKNMPLGHSRGGAAIDFYGAYRHWFTLDDFVSLEYFHTERGNLGRVTVNEDGVYDANGTMQSVERTDGGRVSLNLAVPGCDGVTANLMYGIERVRNHDLRPSGGGRTNQVVSFELAYRF